MSLPNLDVLFEDNHIIVINKPSGILSQGDYSKEKSLFDMVKEYIKVKYNKPGNVYLGLLHRLDKPVSGIIVFAKTSKAASRLSKTIKEHKMLKIYSAISECDNPKLPTEKWIEQKDHLLRIKDKTIVKPSPVKNSQLGQLNLNVLTISNDFSFSLIELITGRKHQIRAQLSNLKLPIVGDKKYGSKEILKENRILLHATFVSFIHPVLKEPISFYSPMNFNKLSYFNEKNINSINSIIKIELDKKDNNHHK